jgi:N utilization substance protein B
MKSPRRRAREFALQGLYQWQLAGHDTAAIEAHMEQVTGFDKSDAVLFQTLLRGVVRDADALRTEIEPHLDRPFGELSPVERAILLLATYELAAQPETPYRVVLNEAVELAKDYGGTDGYKYVNGVLDKLSLKLRPAELDQNDTRRRRGQA